MGLFIIYLFHFNLASNIVVFDSPKIFLQCNSIDKLLLEKSCKKNLKKVAYLFI